MRRGAWAWFHVIWTCSAKVLEYWTISSLKIWIKFQKTKFWKEKSVEDVVTLGPITHVTLIHNLLILINWGCLTSPTYFLFAMSQFDWRHKKIEIWKLPKIEDFMERWCLHIWPTYWEQMKNEKILHTTPLAHAHVHTHTHPSPPNHPPQNLKEKKWKHFECMVSLPIGCMNFLIPKLFVTIFNLD
jgi:hypothetical protein